MQQIDERAIPRIHYSANAMKVGENLTNFLEACKGMSVYPYMCLCIYITYIYYYILFLHS